MPTMWHKLRHKPRSNRARGGKQVTIYVYSVEQIISIKANSEQEAEGLLPMYPTGFEGQAHYVREETVELLREEEGE